MVVHSTTLVKYLIGQHSLQVLLTNKKINQNILRVVKTELKKIVHFLEPYFWTFLFEELETTVNPKLLELWT